ncbi:MAG: PepSY domain-containing protein, partial [Pseudomonadota bacterium]
GQPAAPTTRKDPDMKSFRPMTATLAAAGVLVAGLAAGSMAIAENDKVPADFQAAISSEEAVRLAVEAAGGGELDEVELENEDGTIVYEVELKGVDGKEMEFYVDATTGAVIADTDDDDEDEKEG